ncbi:DEAD/DEAH box helicase [Paenibacillus lemnae]|uniref:DEAD/DEAH box helicase n=1 Tax=Paenibacillus lemnae TaxID=1330551 RepID=A0A848M6W8_PAELE|nr:DEAD/DEAH box helicase [Paenibacillus lemnae]NMO96455.1 DEAD/DEAH box helicase [Paenibacillus lemnae]
MSMHTQTIHVQITLSAYGDALIYGVLDTGTYLSGQYLKQRLFAWHEDSVYGTQLEVQQIQDVELVVLPAEQVIPFFSELPLLSHISWNWGDESQPFMELAPVLQDLISRKAFVPSFDAYKEGKLQWTWDAEALDARARSVLADLEEDPLFSEGMNAAFTASVFHQCFGTEADAADLRQEYPLLFSRDRTAASGMDASSWLIAIGWKADIAPFRPILQLLEPDEEETGWRLTLVLQDKADPTVLFPIRLTEDGRAYGSWPDPWSVHVEERSAGWLERLRGALPASMRSGDSQDLFGGPLTDEAAWRFLTSDSARLLQTGWQVLLPSWWEAASRKRPRLRAKVRTGEGAERGAGSSLFGLDSLVNFDWRIAIGNADLTEAEFAELVARNERLVKFRGQWIPLDPALIAQIRQAMSGVDKSEGLSFQDILHLHLLGAGEEGAEGSAVDGEEKSPERVRLEVELNEHLLRLISQLGRQSEGPLLPVPSSLRAELRHYQHEGYSWLAFLRRFGLGACLADDMGLGKTVQFITYLLHIKETAAEQTEGSQERRPSLLICPTSVLGNWQKELSRFAPSLQIMLHYGSKRYSSEEFAAEAAGADLVLTSYATATLDQELLQSLKWESICLDEAQNIKNAQTKQSTAVRSFPARHRIALTGTPIENKLAELWSIYDFINPGYLGGLRAFTHRFIQAIEKGQDEDKTADLQKLVKPFMLRRKKKDPNIQLDLPDKNEMKTFIHLTTEQGALYDQTVSDLMTRMQKLEGIERKGAILSALTRLKQLCDHPLLLSKEPLPFREEPAGTEASRQLQHAGLGNNLFQGDESGGDQDLITVKGIPAGKAKPSSAQLLDTESIISRSAKLERLLALVKELREEGERCLIFTQYIGMGEMLQQVLHQELGEPVLYLNGSTSKSARDRMIDQFQSRTLPADEQPNVFILSIKAGGVGLNLTAANHVFHYDRWWNPAVENQATDRAYRMGQTKDVQVHKFISLGTLEEKIDEMLESKQQLSDNIISSSEGWITELSTEELKDLFTLRRDWA